MYRYIHIYIYVYIYIYVHSLKRACEEALVPPSPAKSPRGVLWAILARVLR